MKNFLAVFTSTPRSMESSGWNTLTEPVHQEVMECLPLPGAGA